MSKKHNTGLNGYTEIITPEDKHNPTYITITRHMESRKKTYLMYWFKNPRWPDKVHSKEEPEIYRWFFRIRWDKGPLIQRRVEYARNSRPSHWENVSYDATFNVFEPKASDIIERIKGTILEYHLFGTPPNRNNTSNKEDK